MPSGLNPADAKLLRVCAILAAVLLIATGLLSPAVQQGDSPIPSTYSHDPDGALGAYLLLSDLKFPVQRADKAPTSQAMPPNAVFILAEPEQPASAAERRALLDFVSRGGRVLFCGPGLELFFSLPETKSIATFEAESLPAAYPSALSRRADTIRIRPRSKWGDAKNGTLALYGTPARPVVTVNPIGDGEVIWWAAATPLTNTGLAEADNLRLFLNTVSSPDGSSRPVYWDEYFHGQQASLWSYIEKTPLPWGMWQLALAATVVLFAFSRRSGPIVAPPVVSRLSPLEFVDTMGQLYARAGAASVAVEVPLRRLRIQLARKLGRSTSTSDAELAQIAAQRLGFPETETRAALEHASQSATQQKLPLKLALSIVQQLAGYSRQLTRPRFTQEKRT